MGEEREQLRNEINQAILWEYDLPALKIKGVNGGYKVETVRGTKFLRVTQASEEEIILAYQAVEHLIHRGFNSVQPWILTKFGDLMVKVDHQIYYLTDWLDGKEYELTKMSHLAEAVRLLYKMQQAAAGFNPANVPETRESWGKWPQIFNERIEELRRCNHMANDRLFLTEFDQIFLGQIKEVLAQAEKSLEFISDQPYHSLVAKERDTGGICHHDFTSRNLIRQKRQVYLTGFDGVCMDIRLCDLGQLLMRYMPRYYWDAEILVYILKNYSEGFKLNRNERRILWAYLHFPHRIWRLAKKYYLEGGKNSESRLTKAIKDWLAEQMEYQEFIRQLPRHLEID